MNFFEHKVEALEGFWRLVSPLFPSPLRISGVNGRSSETPRVTIGIRPEQVQIGLEPMPISVSGQVVRKFIVVGGQYLLTIKIGERRLKVKVDPELGRRIQAEVWVKCPFEWIMVFGPDGRRLEATLSIERSEQQ